MTSATSTSFGSIPLEYTRYGAGGPLLTLPAAGAELSSFNVLKVEGLIASPDASYYLWTAPHNAPGEIYLYHSNSPEGPWTLHSETPVIQLTIIPDASRTHISAPWVVWNPTDSKFYCYFHAGLAGPPSRQEIFLARSTDGKTWTLYGTDPVVLIGGAGSWEAEMVAYQSVVRVDATHWYMWYEGSPDTGITVAIGLATSSDGLTWSKYGSNPVLTAESALGEPTSPGVMSGGAYYNSDGGGTFYITYSCGQMGEREGYICKTTDGHTFTKYTFNPILSLSPSGWDDDCAANCVLLYDAGTYYLYYIGLKEGETATNIGIAVGLSGLGTTYPHIQEPIDATEVGCTHKYDFSERISPIINHISPGTDDLNNMGAIQGIATSKAPFYGFDGTSTNYMASAGTWDLTDTFSVEAIFSISATTGTDQYVCGDLVSGYATGGTLYYHNSDGKITFYSTAGGIVIAAAAAATLGAVYHVVVTYDKNAGANNTKIYVNGAYSNQATNAASPAQGVRFQISHDSTIASRYLRGRVFLTRVFNRVLTPLEVEQNFQAERWRIPHTKHTWAASPSVDATLTYPRMFNLANQYADLAKDIGPIQATQIVATTTSLKKVGADFVCDGTADDVQIQAALDAADAVGGGTVMILDGTYNLAAPLRVYDNITLCGTGRGTVLSTAGGAGTMAICNDNGDMGNSGIILRDFSIDSAGGGGSPTEDGIYLSGCIEIPYVSVQKVHFTNTFNCIHPINSDHITVEGCSCEGASNGSYLVWGEYSGFIHIVGCMALEFGSIGLLHCHDCMIRSCIVTTHSTSAYYLYGCEHCAVIGCTSYDDTTGRPTDGLYEGGLGLQNLICGNTFNHSSYAGILVEAECRGTIVVSNNCSGAGTTDGYGIEYNLGCTYLNISGNVCQGNHLEGISSDSTSGDTLLYGCINNNSVYYNGTNGIVLWDTSHSTCNGNIAIQNGATTDNTMTNIALAKDGGSGSNDNIVFGNFTFEGAAAPQTHAGGYIGSNCNNNLVTGNYFKNGGKTHTLEDLGTGTDKTAWLADGNKID